MTPEPISLFLDYEAVRDGALAEDARVGATRYRVRPPDSGCQHPQVTFGTPHRGLVDVQCDNPKCGLTWKSVKVVAP